ncbi:MAG: VWA domain-containing protein [Blastocatellia bacterium]|nr:VWA domain-containing protein [Blastocatellia bacterium]
MSLRKKLSIFAFVGLLLGLSFLAGNVAERPLAQSASATPTPPPIVEEDDEVITIDTEAVSVLFTAQDRNRRLLTNLRSEDIDVLENGEVQEIVSFSRQVDLPLSIAILVDTSASQERTLPELKLAATSFLDYSIRSGKDEVAIISFTGESTLEQGMTGNMARLRRAIERVQFVPPSGYLGGGVVSGGGRVPGTPPVSGRNQAVAGATAIWDAVWVASDEVLISAPEQTRRAIILLSDGVNTFGSKKIDDAIQAAQRAEAVVYSIGIGDNFYSGVDKGALQKVSERTGGRAYFPRNEQQLREAFQQINEEMRSQYLVAYEPANQALDGSYRTIEIRIKNPALQKEKVQVTHRKGYFAKTSGN